MHNTETAKSKRNCTDCYQKKRRGRDHIISAAKTFLNYVLSKVNRKSIARELFSACISFFSSFSAIDIDIYNLIRATFRSLRISHLKFHIIFSHSDTGLG